VKYGGDFFASASSYQDEIGGPQATFQPSQEGAIDSIATTLISNPNCSFLKHYGVETSDLVGCEVDCVAAQVAYSEAIANPELTLLSSTAKNFQRIDGSCLRLCRNDGVLEFRKVSDVNPACCTAWSVRFFAASD
jgi:hypothetical protein